MAKVHTYSPQDVKFMLSGVHLTGIVRLKVNFDSVRFTKVKGIRGYNTRVSNSDFAGTFELEVLQTSSTNEVLFNILSNDFNNYNGRLDLLFTDVGGKTMLASSEAYIVGEPSLEQSMGLNSRIWRIDFLSVSALNITGAANKTANLVASLVNQFV